LTKDLNKGIINITYNEMNLPLVIDFKDNNRIEYTYDALGNKRTQSITQTGGKTSTTDFIGNFVYENYYPSYNTFDEGRIVYKSDSTCFVETYIKDHLGNVRVAYANDGIKDGIRQVNAYYPFGMNMKSLSANSTSVLHRNEYLYNGKMFQDELGLNWLDYGARFYDPVVGRWWSVDPMAEKYSSLNVYNYAFNNPINAFDPNGKDGELVLDGNQLSVNVTLNYSQESLDKYNNTMKEYSQEQFQNDFKEYYEAANGQYEIDGQQYDVSFNVNFNVVAMDTDMPSPDAQDGSTNLTFDSEKSGAGAQKGNVITMGASPRGAPGTQDTGGSLSHEILHGLGVPDTNEKTSGKLSSYSANRRLQPSEVSQMLTPAIQFAKENSITKGSVLITHSRGNKEREQPKRLK
jgi:RHS repeat-associated protein